MADHHTETALKLLKEWQTLLDKEKEALSKGETQDLEKSIEQTLKIQQRLSELLSPSFLSGKNKNIMTMLKTIHEEQGLIIASLQAQTDQLGQEIGMLRKSQASLSGYKQKNQITSRFMNERT